MLILDIAVECRVTETSLLRMGFTHLPSLDSSHSTLCSLHYVNCLLLFILPIALDTFYVKLSFVYVAVFLRHWGEYEFCMLWSLGNFTTASIWAFPPVTGSGHILLIHSFSTVHCSCPPHLQRCPWKILSWASKVFLSCVVLESCNPGPHAVGQDSTS